MSCIIGRCEDCLHPLYGDREDVRALAEGEPALCWHCSAARYAGKRQTPQPANYCAGWGDCSTCDGAQGNCICACHNSQWTHGPVHIPS